MSWFSQLVYPRLGKNPRYVVAGASRVMRAIASVISSLLRGRRSNKGTYRTSPLSRRRRGG
jgi:hypothetical protein